MKYIFILLMLTACGTEEKSKTDWNEFLQFFQGERGESDEQTPEEKDGIQIVPVCNRETSYENEEIVISRTNSAGRVRYYKYFKKAPPEILSDGGHTAYGDCNFIVQGNNIFWEGKPE